MANQYAQQLHALLRRAAGLDCAPSQVTESVKAATVQLDTLYKQPQPAISGLTEIALTAPEEQIRQLAAVELRKLINKQKQKTWAKCPEPVRSSIKSRLLQHLLSSQATSSTAKSANNALSRVVAAIGRIEVGKNQWPELLPFIWQAASAANAGQRETGLYTLYSLIDTLVGTSASKSFAQYVMQLYGLLAKTLVDPESLAVRVLSVRVLGNMVDYLNVTDVAEGQAIQSMVPVVMQVCNQALQADDDEAIKHCFEVVETFASADANIVGDDLPSLLQFLLAAGGNQAYSDDAKLAPLNTLWFIVRAKKQKIQHLNLAKPIIEGILPVGALPEPEDTDDEAPARIAFRIVDALANSLPPSQVMPPLMDLCQKYASSPDPNLRKSAIMAFGVTFEGCSLFIAPHMDQLWPFVDQCLVDPDIVVRKAACMALSFMGDQIPAICAKRHATLLPIVMDLVGHDATRRNALNALDTLLEQLGKDIKPYMPVLMERLMMLMSIQNNEVRTAATGAIGSVAHAAKADFAPYFQACMQAFLPALYNKETEGEALDLRSITQDTVGTLADAVGKDVFNPYFQQTMQLAFEGTTVEAATSRECSFIFFGTLARVYKEDFAQYLPTLVPLLLASLMQDEKADNADVVAQSSGFASRTDTPQPNGSSSNAQNEEDDDEDIYEDLDEDDLEEALLGINSAVSSEKEMACSALDEIFSYCGAAFLPYVGKSVEAFLLMFDNFNDSLRKSAFETALSFVSSANKLTSPSKWEPSVNPPALHADVQALVELIVPAMLKSWDDEDDRETANALCDVFSTTLMDVGPALIAPTHLEHICKLCLDILNRKAACQIVDEYEGEEVDADAEASEWDANLIMSASDLISSLSIVVGPEFAPAFQTFLPALTPYLDAKRSSTERSGIMGVFAELINGLKGGITTFTEALFPLITTGLADSDLDVRSNAAFAMGSLVAHSEKDLSSQYLNILQALHGLLDRQTDSVETNQACDNACGAVARLIIKNVSAVPLDQVVPALLACLPVRQDNVENTQILDALMYLVKSGHGAPYQTNVFAVVRTILQQQATATAQETEKPLTEETLEKVRNFLHSLPASDVQQHGLQQFMT